MKILYAEDEDVLRELYALQLEALTNCEVIEVSSGQAAVDYLKENEDVSLVVSDYRMPEGNGDVIYNFLKQNRPQVPFFLVSTYDPSDCAGMENFSKDNPHNAFFSKPIKNLKELAETIKKTLHKMKEEKLPNTSSEQTFYKVKLSRFLRLNNCNCPIYIKISDNKFIRLINKEDLYDTHFIEKYAQKNIDYFYIHADDFLNFASYYQEVLEISLKNTEEKNHPEMLIDIQLTSLSFLKEMISNMGITPEVLAVIDKTVQSSVDYIKKNKSIFPLFEKILKRQSFIFEHTLMTSYLSCAIARELQLETDATMQKLAMAALLHDMALEENPDIQQVEVLEDLPSSLSKKDHDMIFTHPITASNLVKNQEGIPPDVDWIILCHHEHPEGTGYPRGLKAEQIPPLAAIFIVAEMFSRRLYSKNSGPEVIAQFAKEMATQLNKGNFKKALEGLISLIKKTH